MNLKQKIASAIATGLLLASTFAPVSAFADNTITIGPNNGANSTNNATIIKIKKSRVKQKNITIVGVGVNTTQNTGNNTANGNTGGNTTVITGNTTTSTGVTVGGGSNTNSSNCCCDGNTTNNSIDISGNGANSTNDALIVDVCKSKVKQKNVTVVGVDVNTTQNTGDNTADNNTGGNTTVDTGNATTTTTVSVTGGTNSN